MSQGPLDLVELRTGAKVFEATLVAITVSLEDLLRANFTAFYELVEIARNPNHKPFGNAVTVLHERGLLDEDGQMHDTIRDVVLASAEGEGTRLCLVNPVAR